jgi:ABC-type Fe3+ transport system permease subunit
MLIYWLVATELPITLLIQPAGFQTIITRLFIVLHYGAVELMSQMTVSLVLISLLPVLGVYLFLKLNKNE